MKYYTVIIMGSLLYRKMVVTIGFGSLAVVALCVMTGVSVVMIGVLAVLMRDWRPRMDYCARCHRPIYIKGAKVPPYYNPHQSPRHAEPWSVVDPVKSCHSSSLATEVNSQGQLRRPSEEKSPVFRRSCSTRKKMKNAQSETLQSRDEGGSFFRYEKS